MTEDKMKCGHGLPLEAFMDLPKFKTVQETAKHLGITEAEVFERAHKKTNFTSALEDYNRFKEDGKVPPYVREFINSLS